MKTGCIYCLIDPKTNLVRYVGQTIVNPIDRYNHHIYQWKRSIGKITHINSWIKTLDSQNLKPILEIIEDNINEDMLDLREISYIKLFKLVGANLCNHNEGGHGNRGFKHSIESKLKRLETLKTSTLWKEKHIRHSEIMKQKHKEGTINLGYGHLPKEDRMKIGKNHSIKMKEIHLKNPNIIRSAIESREIKVVSLDNNNQIDKIFDSVTKAGKYYTIDPTHISRICKGKSKSGITHGVKFMYLTNIV
jgi:group I intron endonuclease